MTNSQIVATPAAIKSQVNKAIRDGFLQKYKNTSSTFAEQYVNLILSEAMKNPQSDIGKMVAKTFMGDNLLDKLDEDTERLLLRDTDFAQFRIMKTCYNEQKNVLTDTSRRILVNTSRRSGKTELVARWLVNKCTVENSPCLYVHVKLDNALKQCWPIVHDVAKAVELRIAEESKADGFIKFINGSTIKFAGNPNNATADTLRGFKYKGIAIEEAAFQRNLKYLIEDVLSPTMADYRDSQIILISTPPRVPHTYYEHCYYAKNETSGLPVWNVHQWNSFANPFIDFETYYKEQLEAKGLTPTNPFVQRELLGQMGCYDKDAQVIKKFNKSPKHPFTPTDIYGGIDYGFQDYNAIVTIAWDKVHKCGKVLNCVKFNESTVSDIAQKALQLYDEAKALLARYNSPLSNIAFYADTSDKSISAELSTRYGIPVYSCWKHDKAAALSDLSDLCAQGVIAIDNPVLEDEFESWVYKRDEATDAILPELDDDSFHADAGMALLYATRQILFENDELLGGKKSDDVHLDSIDDNNEWDIRTAASERLRA